MKQLIFIFIVLVSTNKEYVKNYYDNSHLKSEGWLINNQKTDYWYYYNNNGKKKAEGHYQLNQKEDYWFFYDENEAVIEQGHYQLGEKNGWWKMYRGDTLVEIKYKDSKKVGLAILKLNSKIIKAEYYKNNMKTDEWVTLADFKKEYPLIND